MSDQSGVPFHQQAFDLRHQRRFFGGVQRLDHGGRHLHRQQAMVLGENFGSDCAHSWFSGDRVDRIT